MELVKEAIRWIKERFQNWQLARQNRRREARNKNCWQMQRSAWDYKCPNEDAEEES